MIQPLYNLVDALAYFAASAVPIYFVIRSRKSSRASNPLRGTMIILAGFTIAQGLYHTTSVFGMALLSKLVLEPLSAAVLVAVAVAYLLMTKKLVKQKVRSEARE